MSDIPRNSEQLNTEDVIEALRRNQWCRATTAHELHVHAGTISQHIARARRLGMVVFPDPNASQRTIRTNKQQAGELYVPRDRQPIDHGVVSHVGNDVAAIEEAREVYGRRLDIALASGNWQVAHELVDEARLMTSRKHAKLSPLLEVAIGETEIDTRTQNMLAELGITTIGDLARHSSEEILAIANFGPKALTHVWHCVLKLAALRDLKREMLLLKLEDKHNAD